MGGCACGHASLRQTLSSIKLQLQPLRLLRQFSILEIAEIEERLETAAAEVLPPGCRFAISSPSGWFRASLDINLYFASANCRKQQSGEKQHKMLLNIPGSLK